MALLRAEIRDRLGGRSIYDGVVEHQDDFLTEPMLAEMHYGSIMLCLNYTNSRNESEEEEEAESDLYIKRTDGSWSHVATVSNSSHGFEPYIVTFTKGANDIWSANHSYSDASTAYNAGKTVLFTYGDALAFASSGTDNGVGYFKAQVVVEEDSLVNQYTMKLLSVGSPNVSENNLEERAKITTATASQVEVSARDHNIYKFATLTALTISSSPVTGAYSIVFTSGSTATTTTIPATILGLEDFAAEANTIYEINVLDNRAVVGKWAVSSGE